MKTLVLEGKDVRGTETGKAVKLLPPAKATETPVNDEKSTVNALIEKLRNNLRTEFSNAMNRQKEEQENAERINLALENLK